MSINEMELRQIIRRGTANVREKRFYDAETTSAKDAHKFRRMREDLQAKMQLEREYSLDYLL